MNTYKELITQQTRRSFLEGSLLGLGAVALSELSAENTLAMAAQPRTGVDGGL